MNLTTCIYPEIIELLLQQNSSCALATVIETQGSTPQKAGSSALIGSSGLLAGTVGGGPSELKVIQHSQLLLKTKQSALLSFDLHGQITKGSESICGGNMTVLLDASPELHLPVFTRLKESIDRRQKGILLTQVNVAVAGSVKIFRDWIVNDGNEIDRRVKAVVAEMLGNTKTEPIHTIVFDMQEIPVKGIALLERLHPKPSLVIAGAGHIGQSLAYLGKFLGFEVTVWDDRPLFADQALIPNADVVLSGSFEECLGKFMVQDDTYLAIVTRGHKNDAEVLRKFIASSAAYIGMIGSKAKVAQMKTTFLENGWATEDQWSRIHSPIGLSIGAQTVEEIAMSIAAELVKVRNEKNSRHE
jgi:xanthine dehydrogenase accessory factor